jgi:uncharacterized oxidoreductase
MNLTGNTILITGGGSGIGLALAQQFHQRGNQVIVAGRRKANLDAATAANPGMHSIVLDTADPASIAAAVPRLLADFPTLNAVLNNAGVMKPEFLKQGEVADAEGIIATNLLGPIRLTNALMKHFLKQPSATILNVSSGLAFVPLAFTPTYCATKAAIHSYTQSLRYQLKDTAIKVIEIIPPWVATSLMGEVPDDPRAMPLDAFIAETVQILATDADEICVERVGMLRNAAASGKEAETFNMLNSMFAEAGH